MHASISPEQQSATRILTLLGYSNGKPSWPENLGRLASQRGYNYLNPPLWNESCQKASASPEAGTYTSSRISFIILGCHKKTSADQREVLLKDPQGFCCISTWYGPTDDLVIYRIDTVAPRDLVKHTPEIVTSFRAIVKDELLTIKLPKDTSIPAEHLPLTLQIVTTGHLTNYMLCSEGKLVELTEQLLSWINNTVQLGAK